MSCTIVMSVALLVVIQAPPVPPAQADAGPEMAKLLRPTQIRLDFDNRTLAEMVAQINTQSSTAVMLPPVPPGPNAAEPATPAQPPRRFSLHEPTTLPFWEAIDRVCLAVQRWPGIALQRDPWRKKPAPEPDPKVVLVPASGDRGYVCTDGLFRVVVARLSYGRGIRFASTPFPGPATTISSQDRPVDETFFAADLIIMVEPRLRIQRLGDLNLLEATDDRGRSLIIAGSGRQLLKDRHGLIPPDGAAITVPLPLSYSSDPGTTIKRLRGRMPLAISERKTGAQPIVTEVGFDFADVPLP